MSIPAYNPQSDELPLSDDELAQLDHLLSTLRGDAVMNLEALDGYLAALLLSPVPLPSLPGEAWMPAIWGGEPEDSVFASGKQRKRLQLLVLRHLHATAKQWQRKPESWEPLFTLAEGPDEQQWLDAEDWALGFLMGVDLHEAAWAPRLAEPQLAEAWAALLLLGGDEAAQTPEALARLDDPAERNELASEVRAGVLELLSASRSAAA